MPGRATGPLTPTSRVPPFFSHPSAANRSPPFPMIHGTLHRVSTLFTSVGRPNAPTTAGNGGFSRGHPRFPSRELIVEVSSPQMYAPAPRCSVTSRSNPDPRTSFPRKPAARASPTASSRIRVSRAYSPRM